MAIFESLGRQLRFGRPIIVVTGLPRSGTSMAMKMLEAGGVPVLVDGIRTADDSNPNGYYELERVKALEKHRDISWLPEARGKAVKIISFLLTWLPETYAYKVVFMQRDLGELLASQNTMLVRRGETDRTGNDEQTRTFYEQHLDQVSRFLSRRPCFSTLTVNYSDVVNRPEDEARRMADFLGGRLDVDRMAGVANPSLYRNRRDPHVSRP